MGPIEPSSPSASSVASKVMIMWPIFMGALLFAFGLTCISQFAQFYQMTIDQEASNKLREGLPSTVRASLLSPGGSGRLILPPPTPKTRQKSPKPNHPRNSKILALSPIKTALKNENKEEQRYAKD
jgi:hypothetical protein